MSDEIERILTDRISSRLRIKNKSVPSTIIQDVVHEVMHDAEFTFRLFSTGTNETAFTSLNDAIIAAEERVKQFRSEMVQLDEKCAGMSPHHRAAFKAAVNCLVTEQ